MGYFPQLAWAPVGFRLVTVPRQQVAVACASRAARRRASAYWFERSWHSNHLFLCSLQSPGLWLHLGHTYAEDGAGRLRPPRRLHGSQGLACAEGILQIPGEGLRWCGVGWGGGWGGCSTMGEKTTKTTETLSRVWKWRMWGPLTCFQRNLSSLTAHCLKWFSLNPLCF